MKPIVANTVLPAIVILIGVVAYSEGQEPLGDPYQPVPAQFRIPTNEAELNAWIREMNVRKLRLHGWQILAALTYPSRVQRKGNDGRLPIWETWYSQQETFQPAPTSRAALEPRFEYPPDQLVPSESVPSRIVSVASRILFNREARDHIQTNCLYTRAKLDCLRTAPQMPVADGNPQPLEIPDFPRESIALKTAWMHVTQKCTPIPVWDGQPAFPRSSAYPPISWRHRVWVYPPSVSPASCGGLDEERVPLDSFYHFQILNKDEVDQWRNKGNVQLDPETGPLFPLDYVILVGLHAATREISNWAWTTFWWHPQPKKGPFGGDRPASVRGVWRNYLMDVAYDMDFPAEHDTSPKITFNPYLEAGLAEGVHSNCMTCHRRATLPDKPNVVTSYSFGDKVQPNQIVVRGSEAAMATYLSDFDSRLKLHFIWSLAAHTSTATDPAPLPVGCGCTDQK